MRNQRVLVVVIFLLFNVRNTTAQLTFQTITLKTDTSSKMVLVSNVADDWIGDVSPLLIAAAWNDTLGNKECRSIVSFDYKSLPKEVLQNPAYVHSAELILYPVNSSLSEADQAKAKMIRVKRVTDAWIDSGTVWNNQPASDTSFPVNKFIKTKQKEKPVTVNVTQLVKDMLVYGNNGFIIEHDTIPGDIVADAALFASPKYNKEELRPALLITYMANVNPGPSNTTNLQQERKMRLGITPQYGPPPPAPRTTTTTTTSGN